MISELIGRTLLMLFAYYFYVLDYFCSIDIPNVIGYHVAEMDIHCYHWRLRFMYC
jgi:hypothetical protein